MPIFGQEDWKWYHTLFSILIMIAMIFGIVILFGSRNDSQGNPEIYEAEGEDWQPLSY